MDEAGMLDQDCARALLTVADECRVRIALLGDRHQLAAVGRGGVLDLAARHADPIAYLTMDAVHRFTRAGDDGSGRTVPDIEYADLSLAMRSGEDPGAVFDALSARGQIQVHPDPSSLQESLAAIAADGYREGEQVAVVVDTREQTAELNAAIRERLVADGRVDDTRAVTTRAGQRIGAGDRVATRLNDRDLGVANRDTWTVTRVGRNGDVTVTGAGPGPGVRERLLPGDYVAGHVELAYASTAHGVQGETVTAAHVVLGEHTGAASAYVGMTRGRTANTAHLIAADPADAREQWLAVFSRDRADLGPGHAADLAAAEAARYAWQRPLEEALADLRQEWTTEQRCLDRLAHDLPRRDALREIAALESGHADRAAALEVSYRQTAVDARHATARAEASEAVVAAETDRIRDTLLAGWDTRRDAAREAAQVVLDGPGRLGLRRAAVNRAGEQLADWADTWRPFLPFLPIDRHKIAQLADRADDRPRLWTAFDQTARHQARQAHPQHTALLAVADTAQAAHEAARRALAQADREHENRLGGFGSLAWAFDSAERLANTDRDIAAVRTELAAVRVRIARLTAEPALLAQPARSLAKDRDTWRAHQDAGRTLHQPAAPLLTAPDPGVLPRRPEDNRPPALHPDTPTGIGR